MTPARNQDGFAVVEVIVSAAVLAIVALAVLAGIDGATASTARERARAVSASLAEKDQERLRSYRFDELTQMVGKAAKDRTQPIVVDGVTYSVVSDVQLVVDKGTANTGCVAVGAKQGEYIRIATTVTSAIAGTRTAPLKIESLVAPPVSGSLVVKVTDVKQSAVSGVTVKATAKSLRSYSGSTNAQGCALFSAIESGDYTITLDKPGYVDINGNTTAEGATTVTPNLVNVYPMTYSLAGRVNVFVKTNKPGVAFTSSATSYPSKATEVSDASAAPNSLRTYTPASGATSTPEVVNLYPFSSGYSFFTGACAIQSPVRAIPNANYFSAVNKDAVVVVDAAKAPQQATVFQPALNIRVARNSDNKTTFDPATIKVTAILQKNGSDGCDFYQNAGNAGDGPALELTTWPSSTTWGTSPDGNTRYWVDQKGTEFDPGYPFGVYKLCLQDTAFTNKWLTATYENNKTTSTNVLQLGASGSNWGGKPSGC